VHTYDRVARSDADLSSPGIDTYRFTSAEDVVAFARLNPYIGGVTWPEVWHLDEHGAFTCYYQADSLSSLKAWAADPSALLRSRWEGLKAGCCPDDWLIIDSRPWSRFGDDIVDEGDAVAFGIVRRELASIGVRLVDALVFDDDGHWWSMRELTTGELSWHPERGATA
jgi:hypothetical protein